MGLVFDALKWRLSFRVEVPTAVLIESVFGSYQNLCYVYDSLNMAKYKH